MKLLYLNVIWSLWLICDSRMINRVSGRWAYSLDTWERLIDCLTLIMRKSTSRECRCIKELYDANLIHPSFSAIIFELKRIVLHISCINNFCINISAETEASWGHYWENGRGLFCCARQGRWYYESWRHQGLSLIFSFLLGYLDSSLFGKTPDCARSWLLINLRS